jgi:hypothetical protein
MTKTTDNRKMARRFFPWQVRKAEQIVADSKKSGVPAAVVPCWPFDDEKGGWVVLFTRQSEYLA